MSALRLRGLWCGAGDLGVTRESVGAFLNKVHQHGFNALFVHVKGGHLTWPSSFAPEDVAEPYRTFDFPAVAQELAAPLGIELHAWFMDFFDSEHGQAHVRHPEWAMLSAEGKPTSEDRLRGRRYGALWQCPARVGGYSDSWLIPLYAEFAERYTGWHSLHHDYVRYPGDAAPDQYCFCDWCLEDLPRAAGLLPVARPEEAHYHELYDREHLEAHWEPSPRVLPMNWDRLPRKFRARFLLEGSFFQGGRADLDYFWYGYRRDAIDRFARECWEAVKAANPKAEISAAVFKNPVHSGRFIGQDWRRWGKHCETMAPMDYRDHFPGDFETYLDQLGPIIELQKGWARDAQRLVIGAAVNFLFWDEERPLQWLIQALRDGERGRAEEMLGRLGSNLYAVDPSLDGRVRAAVREGDASVVPALEKVQPHLASGFLDRSKLARTVEVVRRAKPDGMVLFCAGQLDHYDLWKEAAEAMAL